MAISELLRNVRARPVPHQMSEAPPRSKSFSQQQVYLVSSLPGVGRKLAERLLRKYGTPRRVMSLTQGELSLTPGIGWKRAERIKRLLDEQFVGAAGGESQTKLE